MIVKKHKRDEELIALYRTGDEKAFEELLSRYKSRLYLAIYLIVKDRYVAEDLLQDVFIKVIDKIKEGRYHEKGKFSSWVCRVAHNLAIDYFRKRKRSPTIVTGEGERLMEIMQFADHALESDQFIEDRGRLLKIFIKELPIEQRHVLIMRHYLQMNFKEIAERTGVSVNTALGRMRYALINLRKKMTNKYIAYDSNFYPK